MCQRFSEPVVRHAKMINIDVVGDYYCMRRNKPIVIFKTIADMHLYKLIGVYKENIEISFEFEK